MLVHPDRERSRLGVIAGRFLQETFGLLGVTMADTKNRERLWQISAVYSPIRNRAIGGIRAQVTDQKGFISFINQRDLEVLLGVARPGDYCQWLGKDYVDPSDRDDWIGFAMDEEDLTDDLFGRETELRYVHYESTGNAVLPANIELIRRLHLSDGVDSEEFLLGSGDIFRGEQYPDTRFETIRMRWTRVERTPLIWRQL